MSTTLVRSEKPIRKAKGSEREDTNIEKFSAWLMRKGREMVSVEECAEFLSAVVEEDTEITERIVRGYISSARVDMETHHGKTIWCEKHAGKGDDVKKYRIATEQEKAVFLVRRAKSWIRSGEGVVRLHQITDLKLIPAAQEIVFKNSSKRVYDIQNYNERYKTLVNTTSIRKLGDGK